jgi:lysyl-tRNA synthetase class 2
MLMTDNQSIQDVLFFPQMKPVRAAVSDPIERYVSEAGIPAEWAEVLQKMGYITLDAVRKLSPGKLMNDLGGFNKKNKLGLKNPSAEEVKAWVEGGEER